jgi:hypothetical protein
VEPILQISHMSVLVLCLQWIFHLCQKTKLNFFEK